MEIISQIALSIIAAGCLVLAILQRRDKIKMAEKYVNSELEKAAVLKRLQELVTEFENKKILESDGFLKFVSESRDWAFSYIDDVQEAIKEVDFARKLGNSELDLAIDKLIKLLPEEK